MTLLGDAFDLRIVSKLFFQCFVVFERFRFTITRLKASMASVISRLQIPEVTHHAELFAGLGFPQS